MTKRGGLVADINCFVLCSLKEKKKQMMEVFQCNLFVLSGGHAN